ncbi:hypothetical protein KKA17_01355 [bacterium]|nr:hypothetical protein [bacterium]MBU1884389.1 hypothetical protein [bacterium]
MINLFCKIQKPTIILISLILTVVYVLGSGYDCSKENCIFTDVGKLLFLFIAMCLIFLTIDKTRKKAFNTLVIFIPAFYILFSGLFYIDSLQYEQQIDANKKYIDIKSQYASINFINITKKDFDQIIGEHMEEYKSSVEKYTNELLNGYKNIIGRTMFALIIGMSTILLLEVSMLYCRKEQFDYDEIV